MYGYIYKTTNLLNGKFYIGQKKSSKFLAEKYLGSGVRLKSAIEHYGKENFSVELIDKAYSKQELDILEIYWIDKFNARNLSIAYNLSKGGDGNSSGITWNKGLTKEVDNRLCQSEETKLKRSKALKLAYLENRHNTDYTDEVRKKMSEKAKNRPHPPTTNGRICITNGVQNKMIKPDEINLYLTDGWYKGKTMSGKPAWNKGLTKETDSRVMKYTTSRNKHFENGESIGFCGVKGNNFRKGGKLKDLTKY